MSIVTWCADREPTFGKLTLVFSMFMALGGFPMQIWENYQNAHCGISPAMVFIAFLIYTVRIPYTIAKEAWAILFPDIIGFISSVVLIWQWLYYP